MEELKEGEVVSCLARPFCIAKLLRRLQIFTDDQCVFTDTINWTCQVYMNL
jgi:hypothetical protein